MKVRILGLGWGGGVDPQTAFFVDVGVAHGDDNGVHGDIHHDNIQDLQADAKARDADDVEAAGADGDGLEEAVQDPEVRWYGGCGRVSDVEELEGYPIDAVEGDYHEK